VSTMPPDDEAGRPTPPPEEPAPPPAPPPPPQSQPPPPPPPSWSSQPAGQAAPGVADANARQWAMLAHLSALAGLVIGLNWLGPLIIYLVKKDEHPFIADQSREALNFNISVFIYFIVSAILIFVVIGILLLPVIGIAWVILTVVATVRANNGEAYRYPLSIRFVSS
jgi:uncharacterized protein